MEGPEVIERSGIRLDPTRGASLKGRELGLTRTELRLLHRLLLQPGRTFSRAELVEAATLEEGCVQERTIDVHICALRRKLGSPRWIETVRGAGYRFGTDAGGPGSGP